MNSRIIYFLVLIGCYSSSLSQRVCDLEAHIILPDSGTVFNSPSNVDIDLMIVNRGPDMLKQGDFLAHALKIGGASYVLQVYEVIEDYLMNDTVFVSQNINLSWTVDFESLDACINECYAYTPFRNSDTVLIEREGNPLYLNNNDCVKVGMKTGTAYIDNQLQDNIFEIYPNPTSGMLFLPDDFVSKDFTIINMLGESVLSESLKTNTSIDVSSLTSGFYVIITSFNDGSILRTKFKKN
jgi:hypothetical protein